MPISTWLIVGGSWVLLIALTLAMRNHGVERADGDARPPEPPDGR